MTGIKKPWKLTSPGLCGADVEILIHRASRQIAGDAIGLPATLPEGYLAMPGS